jgi:Flp pilus assembly protein TadD
MGRPSDERTSRARASGPAPSRLGVIAVGLVLAVTVAFLPALDGRFLDWDDEIYVTANPHIADGLSWRTLRAVVTTTHTGNWIPLTWLSHALDRTLFGLEPRGHHAMALALHVANTVLLLIVLHRMTGAVWSSAAVAALFGLHPLHVESVAWISERKDVLSTFFWLLGLLAYARYVERGSPGRYALVVLAFVLGLLAKPMLVTFPFVLLLLDYWPLGRLSWRAAREKIPLIVLSAAFAVGAFLAQRVEGAIAATQVGVGDRIANALVSYVRYLALAAWPSGLSPWYSHPAVEGPPLTAPTIGVAIVVLLGASALALACARTRPYVTVGWLWYVGTLVPVIGLIQVGASGMADRFTYVPLIGVFIAVAWTAAALPLWSHGAPRRVGVAVLGVLLVVLGVLTWRQTKVWHDPATFWATTLERNPRAAIAHYSRAVAAAREGRIIDAVTSYRRALEIRPDVWGWHAQAGDLLYGYGQPAEAERHYRQAIAQNPDEPIIRNSLANILMRQNRLDDAKRELEAARALRPDFAEARNNLGIVLANQGDVDGAIREFEAVLAARPDFAPARGNLAAARAARDEGAAPVP